MTEAPTMEKPARTVNRRTDAQRLALLEQQQKTLASKIAMKTLAMNQRGKKVLAAIRNLTAVLDGQDDPLATLAEKARSLLIKGLQTSYGIAPEQLADDAKNDEPELPFEPQIPR